MYRVRQSETPFQHVSMLTASVQSTFIDQGTAVHKNSSCYCFTKLLDLQQVFNLVVKKLTYRFSRDREQWSITHHQYIANLPSMWFTPCRLAARAPGTQEGTVYAGAAGSKVGTV